MKLLICILVVAFVHRSSSFPVEQPTVVKEIISPSPVSDVKPVAAAVDTKSESVSTPALPVETPVVAEVSLAKKEAVKEESVVAPAAPAIEKVAVKEDSVAEAVKTATAVFDGQSNKVSESSNSVVDSGKSAVEVKPETQPIKPVPVTEQKSEVFGVEPVSKNAEPQKEVNNQINAVSVDEPKPVQNEVKSEIPKDEVKSDIAKTDMPAEKKEEVKPDKVVANEPEPAKNSQQELDKSQPASVSEEKNNSSEQDLSKEDEKKYSSGEKTSAEEKPKSEESEEMPATQPEKKVEEPKKEEKSEEKVPKEKTELKEEKVSKVDSSSKLVTESLVTEAAKSPSSPAPVVVEKSEQDRDVIKREAANKEKHDEKKSTDLLKKEKVTPQIKETFVNKDVKSSKGQDKPVH